MPEQLVSSVADQLALNEVANSPEFQRELYAIYHRQTDVKVNLDAIIDFFRNKALRI